MSFCKWCGQEYTKNHNRQMYCSNTCRLEAKREQSRNTSHRYYHRHKREWDSIRRYGLGSGCIGPHAHTDMDKELKVLQNEKRRLRLNF